MIGATRERRVSDHAGPATHDGERMQRRGFLKVFAGAAATGPGIARAQAAMPVIGYLAAGSPDAFASRLDALRQGLGYYGYAEGRNVAIEPRWASGIYDQLQAFAADLVARKVDV